MTFDPNVFMPWLMYILWCLFSTWVIYKCLYRYFLKREKKWLEATKHCVAPDYYTVGAMRADESQFWSVVAHHENMFQPHSTSDAKRWMHSRKTNAIWNSGAFLEFLRLLRYLDLCVAIFPKSDAEAVNKVLWESGTKAKELGRVMLQRYILFLFTISSVSLMALAAFLF